MVSEVATVPVEGGLLTYEVLAGATEPVLAIHGVSSQRRLWNWLHFQAPELTLVAPDLRGRGDSVTITGPFSRAQHVTDMIILLDRLGIDSSSSLREPSRVDDLVADHDQLAILALRHPSQVREGLVGIDAELSPSRFPRPAR